MLSVLIRRRKQGQIREDNMKIEAEVKVKWTTRPGMLTVSRRR